MGKNSLFIFKYNKNKNQKWPESSKFESGHSHWPSSRIDRCSVTQNLEAVVGHVSVLILRLTDNETIESLQTLKLTVHLA